MEIRLNEKYNNNKSRCHTIKKTGNIAEMNTRRLVYYICQNVSIRHLPRVRSMFTFQCIRLGKQAVRNHVLQYTHVYIMVGSRIAVS